MMNIKGQGAELVALQYGFRMDPFDFFHRVGGCHLTQWGEYCATLMAKVVVRVYMLS